jgi:hypothetical protein
MRVATCVKISPPEDEGASLFRGPDRSASCATHLSASRNSLPTLPALRAQYGRQTSVGALPPHGERASPIFRASLVPTSSALRPFRSAFGFRSKGEHIHIANPCARPCEGSCSHINTFRASAISVASGSTAERLMKHALFIFTVSGE